MQQPQCGPVEAGLAVEAVREVVEDAGGEAEERRRRGGAVLVGPAKDAQGLFRSMKDLAIAFWYFFEVAVAFNHFNTRLFDTL